MGEKIAKLRLNLQKLCRANCRSFIRTRCI